MTNNNRKRKKYVVSFKFPIHRILSLSKNQDSKEKKEFFSFVLTIAEENEKEAIKFYLDRMYRIISLFKDQDDIIKEAKEFFSFLLTRAERKKINKIKKLKLLFRKKKSLPNIL